MRNSQLRAPEALAGIGGLLLLGALFLPWGAVDCLGVASCDPDVDGWAALSIIDVILVFVAAGAIALPVVAASNSKTDAPISGDAFVAGVAILGLLLSLFRLLDPPGGLDGKALGPGLAAVACLVIFAGAWTSLRDEGTARG